MDEMKMSRHLREAYAPEDLPRLVEFVNAAYRGESSKAGRAWTTEADLLDGQRVDLQALQELLPKDGRSTILLFEQGHELLACVNLRRLDNDMAYLGMLTVSPHHQNSGLGRELLDRAEAWCRDQWGTRGMEMTVIQLRQELIQWYQRRGYHPSGEMRPFPYGNSRFGLPRRSDLKFIVLQKIWTRS